MAIRWLLAICMIGLAGLGGMAALGLLREPDGHLPLHIGCTHHNHGPKWHDGHGAALGLSSGSSRSRSMVLDGDDLAARRFTAGRPGGGTGPAR